MSLRTRVTPIQALTGIALLVALLLVNSRVGETSAPDAKASPSNVLGATCEVTGQPKNPSYKILEWSGDIV